MKLPEVTPKGKFKKVGTCVATPALTFKKGDATQQWMCDAVVVPVSPLNITSTNIVLAVVFSTTVAKPVPAEPAGGTSRAPLRVAVNVIVPHRRPVSTEPWTSRWP